MFSLIIFAFIYGVSPITSEIPLPQFSSKLTPQKRNEESYRLPENIIPEHYVLTLDPNFTNFTYSGSVEITFSVSENATNTITLHSVGHAIERAEISCSLANETATEVAINQTSFDTEKEFLIFGLTEVVQENSQCSLTIDFEGVLNEESHGFYRAKYEDEEGNERWLATTQFQATYAREAFPCFDEPSLKATFTVTLIRPKNYTALFNTPISSKSDYSEEKEADYFEITPIMSTYLVAFVISEFTNISSGIQAIYGRPEMINDGRGEFALELGLEILPAIEDFVGLSYNDSMKKLDNVAIPDDYFLAGAMENWGLVTYKEMYLLSKENVTTAAENQLIGTIMAHEYGHKWFGNLVSPSWWNYLWINEGFATYFEYYGASTARPSWRLMEMMALSCLQASFNVDQLENTRPMTYDVESPSEIAAIFDRIAYHKAGSIIRMVENFLTTPVFRNGLNKFLVTNSYNSVTENELWDALQEAIDETGSTFGITMGEIMETWTQQAGFPLVTLELDSTGSLTATQERFILDSSNSSNANTTWYIPLNFVASSNIDFNNTASIVILTEPRTENLAFWISIDPEDWIIANIQQTGYYRVNYNQENWIRLIDYFNSENFANIHPLNRAQLVDDSLVLARAGRLNYSTALNLITYFSRETDYMPLRSLISNINYLNRVLSGSSNVTLFRDFSNELLRAAFAYLTPYESLDDGHIDKLNRAQVLSTMCQLNSETCLLHASSILRTWDYVSPDLQSAVYCGGLKAGGEEEWDYLYSLYINKTTESLQRSRLISALSCTENETLLERVHDMVFYRTTEWNLYSEDDRLSLLSALYTNSEAGIGIALNMNFNELYNSFSVSQVYSILNGLSLRLTDTNQQNTFLRILELSYSSIWNIHGAAFNNAIKNINETNEWVEKYQEVIMQWLIQRLPAEATTTEEPNNTETSTTTTSSSTTTTTTTTTTSTTTTTTENPMESGSNFQTVLVSLFIITLILPMF